MWTACVNHLKLFLAHQAEKVEHIQHFLKCPSSMQLLRFILPVS